jgi:accessory gene regulator protein AgrB
MKYKTTGTKAGHKLFVRKRNTAFDTFNKATVGSIATGEFTDHKEMKIWEYAAFQKEQFKAIKKRKRRFYLTLVVSLVIAIILLSLLPFIFDELYQVNSFRG